MKLFVFNCFLLASVAVAIPAGQHKRDLAYLKNLIRSAIFGRSQINSFVEPVLREETRYKLFRLPGLGDVIKFSSEPVMKYTAYYNPGVEPVETIKSKPELPMCIKERVHEAIRMGLHPNRFAPVQDVYKFQSPSFVDYFYPRVEANSYGQNSFRKQLTKEAAATNTAGLISQRLRPSKDSLSILHYNSKPTMTNSINTHPYPRHLYKSLHSKKDISASKDKVNSSTRKIQDFGNLGVTENVSKTLAEYIARVNDGRKSHKIPNRNMKHIKAVPTIDSKDNILNENSPFNVYKLRSNLNTGKVMKENDALRTNGKLNNSQHINGPAVNNGTEEKDTAQIENVYSDKRAANPQNVTRPVSVASTNAPKQPLRENNHTSAIYESTDVKDNNNHSYEEMDGNDSSLNVNGNKHSTSVSLEENNDSGRGDITDQ